MQEKIEKFINDKCYLDSKMTLSKMAVYVDANPAYLNDMLRNLYGKTYIGFINDLRLEALAFDLKTKPNLLDRFTISAIIKDYGFDNYSTFLYTFRRKYKTTPNKVFVST